MTIAEYITLFTAIAGVMVTLVVGLPRLLEWHERWRQRQRTAERKLREARHILKKAKDMRWEAWTLVETSSLDSSRPDELRSEEFEEEARSHLLDALELGPSREIQVEIHLELGKLAHQRGEPDVAEEELTTALRLNRRFAKAYEELGLLRWWRGDITQALEDMENARKLLPRSEREEIERRLHSWRDQLITNEKRKRND
jgi:tetratricopeptide (TPR) repeat protein